MAILSSRFPISIIHTFDFQSHVTPVRVTASELESTAKQEAELRFRGKGAVSLTNQQPKGDRKCRPTFLLQSCRGMEAGDCFYVVLSGRVPSYPSPAKAAGLGTPRSRVA